MPAVSDLIEGRVAGAAAIASPDRPFAIEGSLLGGQSAFVVQPSAQMQVSRTHSPGQMSGQVA